MQDAYKPAWYNPARLRRRSDARGPSARGASSSPWAFVFLLAAPMFTPSPRRPRMSRKSAEILARLLPEDERALYIAAVAPDVDPVRAEAGRLAREHGDEWEQEVARHHRAALAAGLAFVRKVGAPVKVDGDGLPCRWAGVGGADYVGVMAGGRALAAEAKSCVGRLQRDDLAPHQRNDLARVEEMGGLAVVLVELRAEGGALLGRWCAPWSELEARWRVSRRAKPCRAGSERAEDHVESRSVGPSELAGLEVDPGCYLRPWAASTAAPGAGVHTPPRVCTAMRSVEGEPRR